VIGDDNPLAFLKQSFKNFRTTGALAPSGIFLARALAKSLPAKLPVDYKVLEVGPGTGSVTDEIIRRMNGTGTLELWEISPEFCDVLRKRLTKDERWTRMASRVSVHQGDVRTLKIQGHYDAIVSGLPFNNFEPHEVQGFLEHFRALLKPQGLLAWFEYVAIRKLQSPFVSKERRQRLAGVRDVTRSFARAHQFKQAIVPINFPPARVRYLKFG
jgi:phospholipid N-methyltransferase